MISWPADATNLKGSIPSNGGIHSVSKSLKYLISSFPNIKTVAYTHLPDTVWRPLFIGKVSNPQGVVADPLNGRLYVADPDLNKIFWYQLIIEDDGLLKTDGFQHVAVDGVTAYWMNVDGLGDLYFSGQMLVKAPASSYRSVYRMDESKISRGDALNPAEVYSRSNTGYPTPHVWMPSGVAVDSFNIYWGNQEKGTTNGAVCSGTRRNIGVTSALEINVVSDALNEVRGMAIAGETIFYLSPQGIYGTDKTAPSPAERSPNVDRIQSAANAADGWDPKSIAFDGEGTMYWTETKAGIIYQFPAGDTNPHPLNKYIDAPQVYGVTIYAMTGEGKKKADRSYGMLQSSAKAEESSSFHSTISAILLSTVLLAVAF